MYTSHGGARSVCTCIAAFGGGEEKDGDGKKITNRDVAVIRARAVITIIIITPGRRIIIICESVVVLRYTHTHTHTMYYIRVPKSLRIIIILLGWSDVVIKDRCFCLSLSPSVCLYRFVRVCACVYVANYYLRAQGKR